MDKLSLAGLLHRSWLMSAPWLSLSLVVSSAVDKKRKQSTIAYTLQIQARLNTDSAVRARDTALEKHLSSRDTQQKVLRRKLQDLVSLERPSQQTRLSCPRILTAKRVVLESRYTTEGRASIS